MNVLSDIINPYRIYLEAGALAAALAIFGMYHHHVVVEGEHIQQVADARVQAAAIKQAAAEAQAAQTKETVIHETFEKAVSIPAVGDIGVECVRRGASPSMSGPSGSNTGAAGAVQRGGANPQSFDPSGKLLTIGRNADAKIRALQDENALLRSLLGNK